MMIDRGCDDIGHQIWVKLQCIPMLLLMSGCVASAPQWYSTFSTNGPTEDAQITRRGDAKAKSMTLARNTAIARAKRKVADALGCATVSGQVDRIELKDGHVYLL